MFLSSAEFPLTSRISYRIQPCSFLRLPASLITRENLTLPLLSFLSLWSILWTSLFLDALLPTMCALAIPVLGRWRHVDPWGMLARQPSLLGYSSHQNKQTNKKLRWIAPKEHLPHPSPTHKHREKAMSGDWPCAGFSWAIWPFSLSTQYIKSFGRKDLAAQMIWAWPSKSHSQSHVVIYFPPSHLSPTPPLPGSRHSTPLMSPKEMLPCQELPFPLADGRPSEPLAHLALLSAALTWSFHGDGTCSHSFGLLPEQITNRPHPAAPATRGEQRC